MPEQPILFRQWSILHTLGARHHGVTVDDLSHEMGVSSKTIRRDLELFRTLGFPVTEEKGYRGLKKWRMDASALTPITFTFEEALALTMGRRGLDPLKGTLFWDAANSAMKKIRASLRDDVVDYINRHAGAIHQTMIGVNDYSEKKEMLDQIIEAMEDRRMIIISYQPDRSTEPVTYEIYVYGLSRNQNAFYIVAWSRDANAIRHFKLNRLVRIEEISDLRFEIPADFSLEDHFRNSFGIYQGNADGKTITIKARFDTQVARFVSETTWHTSQKLKRLKTGEVELTFKLGSTAEVKQWLLSFSTHVEVLEPKELRAEFLEKARRMMGRYARENARKGANDVGN